MQVVLMTLTVQACESLTGDGLKIQNFQRHGYISKYCFLIIYLAENDKESFNFKYLQQKQEPYYIEYIIQHKRSENLLTEAVKS